MMQYQYKDELGNRFQDGDQLRSTTRNWNRVKKIQSGDWFVAYLSNENSQSGNAFFAVGQVRTPRKAETTHSDFKTVAEYVKAKKSHQYTTGVIHYSDAPVFYEDFSDKWRASDPLMRYAQRVDVEEWQLYAASGIPWLSNLSVPVFEIQNAFFGIKKRHFDRISKDLAAAFGGKPKKEPKDTDSNEIVDEDVVDALEKSHARSQGFMLDSKLRAALEKYSMEAATRHFKSQGYTVEDHSKNHPYDLKCFRSDETLYVEVKGTQTDGKAVILTSGEVEFANRNSKHMVLFVLHSIQVSKDRKKLSNGVQVVIHPWVVRQAALQPLSYKYEVPRA